MADSKEEKDKKGTSASAKWLANFFGGLTGSAAEKLQQGPERNASSDKKKNK